VVVVIFVASSVAVLVVVAFARRWWSRIGIIFGAETVLFAMVGLAFTLGDHGGWEERVIVFIVAVVERIINSLRCSRSIKCASPSHS
jgi:hypothetical protein